MQKKKKYVCRFYHAPIAMNAFFSSSFSSLLFVFYLKLQPKQTKKRWHSNHSQTIWKFSRKVFDIANLNCVKRTLVFGMVKTEILCSTKMHMIWNDVCVSRSLMAQLNWHKFNAGRRFHNNNNIKIRIICYFACEQHWQWTHFVFTICCFFSPIRFISCLCLFPPGTTALICIFKIWNLCCVVKTIRKFAEQ